MIVKRYRPKPPDFLAVPLKWNNWSDICEFIPVPEKAWGVNSEIKDEKGETKIGMIMLINGEEHRLDEGDYIIKDVNTGEFSYSKKEDFERDYEEAI